MTPDTKRTLLVIDDQPDVCEFIATIAERLGFASEQATSHDSFMVLYQNIAPQVIVMDLTMPDGDGVELLRFLHGVKSKSTIVLISGFDHKVLEATRRLAEELGLNVAGVLQKPISSKALIEMLKRAPAVSEISDANDVGSAIEQSRIICLFQPKVYTTGWLAQPHVEAEALARWNHPTRGLLSPSEFLGDVARNNLIGPMTRSVMKQSLEFMREWERQGLVATVAINVSPRLLNDIGLPDEFAAMTRRYGVDCSRIIIEITEAAVMEETVEAMDILTRFRLKGFRLSLDDFGTGFSSLVRLYRLPFSELKIDQSFVRDLGRSEEARVIVRTIANLGHDLKLSVCAEGVEDAAAQDFVTRCKCESMQGFFFSRPIPGEEIPAFFGHKARHRQTC